jgi:FlaA1/EpsC-like NDP-sugar epimerase
MRAIYCAGEQSQVVVDILRAAGETENIVLIDDDPAQHTEQIAGHNVIGGLDELIAEYTTETQCIVAFGDRPGVRLRLANRLSTHDMDSSMRYIPRHRFPRQQNWEWD